MTTLSTKLYDEACHLFPGGVNSPVRAWRNVDGRPLFIARARGATVTDADGRSYCDFVGSWGAAIAGHAHPAVVAAVRRAAEDGLGFGAPTEAEVRLGRAVVEACPSVERIRMVSSGTEATMSAIRVARAFTGRPKILKFAGCYHGHSDGLLVRAGSGALTFGVPDSGGVPESIAANTLIAQFNSDEAERYLEAYGPEIAAVIVEPIPANMGVVPAAGGFLERLGAATRSTGALLIFDEVISGFRVARGGAQARLAVEPDLSCFGKIIGGGLPVGAFGGRRDIMELLAPLGPVYQAGTLSGNPVTMAAGRATLDLLDERAYARLEAVGERIETGLREALHATGIAGCVQRVGSMFTLFFGVGEPVADLADVERTDRDRFRRFFHGMLERGCYLPPSPFEAAFVSLAHTDADVDGFLDAAKQTLAMLG